VFSLAAALAPTFDMLLAMRLCAGLLSSGMIVLSSTIIRDRFSGDKMARTQSLVGVVFMIVPMAAPALGQAVLLVADWRWVFGIMAGLGAAIFVWTWVRLPETLHPEFRQPIRIRAIAGNMRMALGTRAAMGYVLGMALIQGALFGYINSSQQLVAEHFGAGELFPLVFGGMAVAMALANLANSRIVMRFGARRVSHTAVFAYIVLAGVQLWLATGEETIWQFIPVMTLNLCVMGFLTANFQAIALQPFARIAGAAASLQVFLRLVIGSTLGAVIGQAYDGSARPLAMALLVAGIGCLLLVLYSEDGKLFRRLHGQVEQA
jgi:MFS transporter, DHA1 family, multidrug resistance protein